MTVDQSKQSVIQPLLNATPPDPEALPEEPEPPVEEPTPPIEEEESMAITVVSVADGDTITVNKDGENVSIRFSCIDAPELSQSPFGLAAKTRLREILPVGTVVTLREIGEDQFNRLVAEVYKDGESINLQLVAEGHAVIYPEYFGECAATQGAYTEAQEAAQEERLNFWNQDNPLMPWLFRSLDPAPTTCNFVSLPTNPILTTGVTDNEARISFASSGMTVDKSSSSGTFSIIVKRTGDLSKGISANVVLHPGYGHPKAFEYSNNRQIVAWGENDSTDKLVSFNILPTNRPFEHVTAVFSDWFNCSSGQYSEIQLCLDN
jgi:endonuclease YncB( thermonuclease family)